MVRVAFLLLLVPSLVSAEDYCFGFLHAHPERKEIPQAEAEAIQTAHLAHMEKMGVEGKLLAAGPMATPGGPRGIVLYRCSSIAEATASTALDPAVVNKRLSMEFHRWRAGDGFGEPLMTKLKADPQAKYEMVRLPLIVLRKTEKLSGSAPPAAGREHFRFQQTLLKEGKLRAAGPFLDDQGRPGMAPGILGLFLFSAMSLEDARTIAEGEPMVREGYVKIEPHVWFVADEVIPKAASGGSAARP
jgi:uncharacterized protein YciI